MKKKWIIIIAAAVILIAAAITVFVIISKNNNQTYDPSTIGSILIPGYPEICIEKDTTEVEVSFQNPSQNNCYFIFELILKEGDEILYTSEKIAPGDSVENITLSRSLSKGEYPAIVKISTESVSNGTKMNGANIETIIKVN